MFSKTRSKMTSYQDTKLDFLLSSGLFRSQGRNLFLLTLVTIVDESDDCELVCVRSSMVSVMGRNCYCTYWFNVRSVDADVWPPPESWWRRSLWTMPISFIHGLFCACPPIPPLCHMVIRPDQ